MFALSDSDALCSRVGKLAMEIITLYVTREQATLALSTDAACKPNSSQKTRAADLQGGAAIITDLLAFFWAWTKNRIDDLLGGGARMGDVTRSHRNTLATLNP